MQKYTNTPQELYQLLTMHRLQFVIINKLINECKDISTSHGKVLQLSSISWVTMLRDDLKQWKMYVGLNYPVPAGASIDSSLNAILLPDASSTILYIYKIQCWIFPFMWALMGRHFYPKWLRGHSGCFPVPIWFFNCFLRK